MDQVLAVDKHECPACGAQAEWNPSTQKLACPFCGTESAATMYAGPAAITAMTSLVSLMSD